MSYEFNEVELREKLETVGVTLGVDPAIGYRFPLLQSENLYPLGVLLATPQGFEALVSGVHRPVSTPESESAFVDFMAAQVAPMDERIAPDCRGEKHRICDGLSWSNKADRNIPCACVCHAPALKAAA
jgi:hypothetical protein